MERRRVVVTGLGAINAIGHNVEETWKSIKEGVCGIDEITNYDKELTKVKIAGEVKNFNAADYLDKKAVRKMDRFTQFGVIAAKEAFKDAGLKIEEIDADRFGVVVSSGIGGLATIEKDHTKGLEKGYDRVSPFFVPMSITNLAAGNIAIELGAKDYVLVRSQLALVELMRLVMRLEISVMVIKKLWLLVGQKLVLLHLVLEAFHQ